MVGGVSMEYPSVFIIIVNYNGWKDTIECLESLQNISYPNYQVVLVDNGSTDESLEYIKKWCSGDIKVESSFIKYNPDNKPVYYIEYDSVIAQTGGCKEIEKVIVDKTPDRRLVIIKSDKNLGFSGGNNIGIKYSLIKDADYVFLLNNDTVVDKSILKSMIEVAESDRSVGIVGGKIYYYDDCKKIWSTGGFVSKLKGSFVDKSTDVVDKGQFDILLQKTFISGCAMLVKRKVFELIGLLPEVYFFGVEDIEFCYKASRKGIKLTYCPKAVLWHKVGASHKRFIPKYIYNSYLGKILFIKRNTNRALWYIWYMLFWIYCKTLLYRKILKIAMNKGIYYIDKSGIHKALKKAMIDGLRKDSILSEYLEEWDYSK